MKTNPSRRRLLALAALAALPEEVLAQDATRIQPDSYRIAFENAQVRVLEFRALPGMGMCGTGVHSHPAHLTIAITAARVRVKQDGKTLVATVKPGTVFWSEAETHETENISGGEAHALIVEIKRA